jgi:hypothetical protein
MDAPLTVPAAPTQPLEAENSFSSTHCQNLTNCTEHEAAYARLVWQLLFAARDLAESLISGYETSARRCLYCKRGVDGTAALEHYEPCRVQRVLEILDALTLLRAGDITKSTGKEAAPSQVETGRAGDGIRPRVRFNRVCGRCGSGVGDWLSEQRPESVVELSHLRPNQCVAASPGNVGHTLFTHVCLDLDPATRAAAVQGGAQ